MKKLNFVLAAAVLGMVVAFFGCGSSGGGGGDKAGALLDLINNERASLTIPALTSDATITAVAEAYTEVFGPTGTWPYADNYDGTPAQRLTNGGVSYTTSGETGYVQFPASGDVNDALSNMNSGTLTNAAFTRVGIGVRKYY